MKISATKKCDFFNKLNTAIQSKNKKAVHLFFAIIIAFQVAGAIYTGSGRSGFFMDELYSFGLSNSVGHAFLNKDVSIHNKWVGKDYFHKYLTVQKSEVFSYPSVYKNQVKDCHPPLYYFALHTICSFFPEQYSQWHGIALNIALFILCQIFLVGISMQITRRNVWLSAAILVLYGGTLLAINNVLLIRMYMMLTLWAVVSTAIHLSIFNNKADWKKCLLLGLVTFAGCMTQYYFGIYSFFLAAALGMYYLCKKKYQDLLKYSATMILAAGTFILAYPAVFEHIFGGRRVGSQSLENATQLFLIPYKCLIYAYNFTVSVFTDHARLNISIIAVLFILTLLMLILLFKSKGKNVLAGVFYGDFSFLTAAVAACFVTVALLSFDAAPRYMYFLYPLLVLIGAVFFMTLVRSLFEKYPHWVNFSEKLFLLAAICISLNCILFRNNAMTVYEAESVHKNMLKKYSESYGIFVSKVDTTAALMQECRAVMQLQGIYCMEQTKCKEIGTIMSGKKSTPLIVWIDKDKYWSSGYDSEDIISDIMKSGLYVKAEKLYSYSLVECYVFN